MLFFVPDIVCRNVISYEIYSLSYVSFHVLDLPPPGGYANLKIKYEQNVLNPSHTFTEFFSNIRRRIYKSFTNFAFDLSSEMITASKF